MKSRNNSWDSGFRYCCNITLQIFQLNDVVCSVASTSSVLAPTTGSEYLTFVPSLQLSLLPLGRVFKQTTRAGKAATEV